jgi:hypothetical protein
VQNDKCHYYDSKDRKEEMLLPSLVIFRKQANIVALFARLTQKTKNVVAFFNDITQQSKKHCQTFFNLYSKNVVVEDVQSHIVAKDEGIMSIWTFKKSC